MHQSAHGTIPEQSSRGNNEDEEEVDPELTPEEFKRLQLEVERLGRVWGIRWRAWGVGGMTM